MCRKLSPASEPLPLTVAIIGAGPAGRWLALKAARAGFRVFLEDVMPASLRDAQDLMRREQRSLPDQGAAGSGTVGAACEIHFASTIEDAVREADLAIDCVPDELESKLEIFCLLDRMAPPRTVLMTPTTRLSIADLAACTYRPDKCVAIDTEASRLMGAAGRDLTMRTTVNTAAETTSLSREFLSAIGFRIRVGVDVAG
jgi:3-hydroxybutyryl-CoA dehydrogenase